MNPLAAAAIGAIIRFFLTIGAGYFVSKGIWTQAEAGDYVAAATLALVGLGWSLWQKYKTRLFIQAALDAPQGTPEATVKAMAKHQRVR
jgi:hypothetical protein